MATKQQVPKIAATFTEFQEGFEDLSTEDGQWVIQNGKEAVAVCVKAVTNRMKAAFRALPSILSDVISTFTALPTTTRFFAKGKFVVNTSINAEVKISFLSENFVNWFWGKTEDPFSGGTVYGRELRRNSVDGSILIELGSQETALAETTLTEIYAMMSAQPNGESGKLLNNGHANIFYVRDINGVLCAVRVDWDRGGWSVDADSVRDPHGWPAGLRVFSRNYLVN